MDNIQWALAVKGNPGLAEWDIGPHLYFWHDRDDGVNLLRDQEIFYHHTTLEYFQSGIYRTAGWDEDIDVTLEELENPFDINTLKYIQQRVQTEPSLVKDYIQLSVNEPLVREVLLLLTLGEEETIYFLVNTYKIFENIRHELGLKVSNGKVHGKKDLPSDLLESLSELAGYSHYINSKNASGILSRHGAGNTPAPVVKPSLIEIKRALYSAVNNWLNHKCMINFGRLYKLNNDW
ncbi:hypothetical protein FZC66_04485 [Priestia megaterium]|nr:hypothetical protein FZC66_04485 [Priestia megaterium]